MCVIFSKLFVKIMIILYNYTICNNEYCKITSIIFFDLFISSYTLIIVYSHVCNEVKQRIMF